MATINALRPSGAGDFNLSKRPMAALLAHTENPVPHAGSDGPS